MDVTSTALGVLLLAAGLGILGWLSSRLLRWARSGGKGAHAVGVVLTEVTQGPAVREAKQGKKRKDSGAGDPANEE